MVYCHFSHVTMNYSCHAHTRFASYSITALTLSRVLITVTCSSSAISTSTSAHTSGDFRLFLGAPKCHLSTPKNNNNKKYIVFYHLMLVVPEERDILSFLIHSIFCIITHKCINCYPVKLGIYISKGV